uniref:PawS-like protein 1b n=1 Tax=Inula racemosa TaxID=483693 RepID=A0A1V0JB67_9ASTR|nr:PawS-like protein 1b [Inula racemosa]
MAKLALVALIVLTACILATFSHQVSAYKTIITTTTIHDDNGYLFPDGLPTTIHDNGYVFPDGLPTGDDNPSRGGSQPQEEQCRSQVERQQLNHCQMHLTQGQGQEQEHLQQCCDQLKQVRPEQCQCEAIQNVVQQAAQQQQQQQGGRRRGGQGQGQQQQQQIQEILRKAQMLPNQCNLQVKQCPIRIPFGIPSSSWF